MKKGFVLITVLALLIMVALGAAAILQSVGSQTDMKSNNVKEIKTRYLAEAAMQHAIWKCRANGGVCSSDSITEDVTVPYVVTGPDLTTQRYTIQVDSTYANVQS